jgi:DNA-directed RNA polymerase subunit RPC12/RpoP
MQKEVYSWFGYYPWECPLCREKTLVRQQHRLKKRSEGEQHEAQRT